MIVFQQLFWHFKYNQGILDLIFKHLKGLRKAKPKSNKSLFVQ